MAATKELMMDSPYRQITEGFGAGGAAGGGAGMGLALALEELMSNAFSKKTAASRKGVKPKGATKVKSPVPEPPDDEDPKNKFKDMLKVLRKKDPNVPKGYSKANKKMASDTVNQSNRGKMEEMADNAGDMVGGRRIQNKFEKMAQEEVAARPQPQPQQKPEVIEAGPLTTSSGGPLTVIEATPNSPKLLEAIKNSYIYKHPYKSSMGASIGAGALYGLLSGGDAPQEQPRQQGEYYIKRKEYRKPEGYYGNRR